MVIKRVLCPERVRKIPPQFSWVDHRLVRDRHIARCDAQALALYLFLVTVADAHPAALGWLGAVAGHRTRPLGVEHFGQSGSIPDLYRLFDLSPEQIVNAALVVTA